MAEPKDQTVYQEQLAVWSAFTDAPTPLAARADVVAEHQKHITTLTNAIIELQQKQASTSLTAMEAKWSAKHASDYIDHLAQAERHREAEQHALYGAELIPYVEDIAKLPVRYSDKKFWYMSLPLTHGTLFFKRMARWAASFVVTPDASVSATRQALEEAHRDRELLNIIRIQRKVAKVKRAIGNAIRKNKTQIVERIGKCTPENEVAAQVLQQHFIETQLCTKVMITADGEKLFLHVDIAY